MIGLATASALLILAGGAVTYLIHKVVDRMNEAEEKERKENQWSD